MQTLQKLLFQRVTHCMPKLHPQYEKKEDGGMGARRKEQEEKCKREGGGGMSSELKPMPGTTPENFLTELIFLI